VVSNEQYLTDLFIYQAESLAASDVDMIDGDDFEIEYDGGHSGDVSISGLMAEALKRLRKAETERDELAAGLGQMLEARSAFMGSRSSSADSFSAFLEAARDVEDATTAILTRRDARMKAEALEALNPHDLSRFAKSIGEDAWDMNPVGICKLVNRMANLHREQAATEAMDAIDGEDGDFANVRGVVERMIAAGYRKQAEGNGDE